MPKLQSRLTLAITFTTLAVIAFFVTTYISSPIDFLYREASGLSTVRNIAGIAALLALIILFGAGLTISIPLALQPATWLGKIGRVLPVFLLLFALAAVLSALLGVGTTGNLTMIQGVGAVTFIAAWLGLAALVTTVGMVIAVARAKHSASALKNAARITAAASGLSVLAAIAMLVSIVIVASSQPASFGRPGEGQFPGGAEGSRPGEAAGQAAPAGNIGSRPDESAGQGQSPEATREPQAGAPGQMPEGTGEPQAGGFAPGGQGGQQEPQGGFPGGDRPQGEFPQEGGPGGGGSANVGIRYAVGGAFMIVFAVVGFAGSVSALAALRELPAAAPAVSPVTGSTQQLGLAVVTLVGLGIIVVGVIQLIPVAHTNPPVKTPISWDSDQTKQLVYAACMDCHSNETTWPWYAYVAPASWLTSLHVVDGRQEMNLSEMDTMPSFRRRSLAENMAQQIRSGNMPPKDYLILHPDARLTDAEKEALIQGLQKSLSAS